MSFKDLRGLTYVAGPTSAFAEQLIEIVGLDSHLPGADRWIIRAPDGSERSVAGAYLRPLVGQVEEAKEGEEQPPPAARAGSALESPQEEGGSTLGEDPAVASASAPAVLPAAPALRFEDVPLKIVLYLHPRPDGAGRQVWLGLSQPGQELIFTSMSEAELGELPPAILHLIGQLEASFPARQAEIAAALKAAVPVHQPVAPTPAAKSPRKAGGKPHLPPVPAQHQTPPLTHAQAAPATVPAGQTTIFDQIHPTMEASAPNE
jgi:hypothetical protein